MPKKNVDLEILDIWRELNKHHQILEKIITVLDELRVEIDKIKADNLAHHKDRTKNEWRN